MPTSIFINYRRKRAVSSASLLYLMLEQRFPGEVFMDMDLQGGDRWDPEIEARLRLAKVVIALIHPKWLFFPSDQEEFQSLEEVKDFCKLHKAGKCFVRKELEIAVEEKKTIIPLLLDGASPPPKAWLPESLQSIPDTFNYTALNFKEPYRDKFKAFFENVAEKAGLTQQNLPDQGDLFYQPLNERFPLPDILKKDNDQEEPATDCPFMGLKPFRRQHARLFFGRNREIYDLCHRITERNNASILLLDGYSGTGKSSLLHAGLIPRMERQGWAVEYGRREEDKERGLTGVFESLASRLRKNPAERGLLIIDQVEEVLSNPIQMYPDELKDFLVELEGARQEQASWKFVLAFRSEFRAHLMHAMGQYVQEENTIAHHTVYPLDYPGIVEAIGGVASDLELNKRYKLRFIPRNLPHTIADRLTQSRIWYHIAPLLQVNMELLWHRCRKQNGNVRITTGELDGLIDSHEKLLEHYLQKVRGDLQKQEIEEYDILDVLQFFTEKKSVSAVKKQESIEQASFSAGSRSNTIWKALKEHNLITGLGDKNGDVVRLTHDVLAGIIADRYEKAERARSDERGRRNFELLEERIREQIYQLEYEQAQESLLEMSKLGLERRKLIPHLFELIFFWNEAGKGDKARTVLQTWIKSDLLSGSVLEEAEKLTGNGTRDSIRKWLRLLDPLRYADMERKYLMPEKAGMAAIPGGEYPMGSEEGHDREKPVHDVTLDSFFMGVCPVTFWQYGLYCINAGKKLPDDSGFGRGDHPVINLQWYDVVEYCNWLSEQYELEPVYRIEKRRKDAGNLREEGDDKKWTVIPDWSASGFRLPTEAEWEYAAREGGKQVRFGNGKMVADSDEINFDPGYSEIEKHPDWYRKGEYRKKTTPVGQFAPNALGLHDMSGNVYDWCWDWFGDHYYQTCLDQKLVDNPKGPDSGESRVVRGGSWYDNADFCRASFRGRVNPLGQDNNLGFRVVRRRSPE